MMLARNPMLVFVLVALTLSCAGCAQPVSRQDLVSGAVQVSPRDELEYVWIAPGSFVMGCVPGDEWCYDQEKPRHTVTISRGFWIGRTEVMAAAYERFAEAAGLAVPPADGPAYPVTGVDWKSAQAYCAYAGGRLPTEAEWEYAARGGLDGSVYPGAGPVTHDLANYSGIEGRDNWEELAPVGSFPAAGFGLHDMAGNAWEWVADWMDEEYYSRSPELDPAGPAEGEDKVVRGGSAENAPHHLRLSLRMADKPDSANPFKGFRCVIPELPGR